MFKFIHLSDVHINKRFSTAEEGLAVQLRDGLIKTFKQTMKYAMGEKVDAIVIAGDFFDNDYLPDWMADMIHEQFKNLLDHGIKIFYCSGNHDPSCVWENFFENYSRERGFYYFSSSEPEQLNLTSSNGVNYVLCSCGHETSKEGRNIIQSFPPKSNDQLWIGLAHAYVVSTRSAGEHVKYLPTTIKDLEALAYDYFALGHIHQRECITDRIVYSGCPQGLNVKEWGEKGFYLVELGQGHIQKSFIPLGEVIWLNFQYQCHSKMDKFSDIKSDLLSQCERFLEDYQPKRVGLNLKIGGYTPCAMAFNDPMEMEILHAFLLENLKLIQLNIDSSSCIKPYPIDEIMDESTVLSEALHWIFDEAYTDERQAILKKLPLGTGNLSPEEKKILWEELKDKVVYEVISHLKGENNEN